MSGHISSQDIRQYSEKVLTPARLMALFDHCAECEACPERLAQSAPTEGYLAAIQADLPPDAAFDSGHLTYNRMEAYVDDQMAGADREKLERHIQDCANCLSEVNDLREFQAGYNASTPNPPSVESAWRPDRFKAYWRRPALRYAGAAAVILIIVSLAILLLVRRGADLPQQAGETAQDGQTARDDSLADQTIQREGERASADEQPPPAVTEDADRTTGPSLKDSGRHCLSYRLRQCHRSGGSIGSGEEYGQKSDCRRADTTLSCSFRCARKLRLRSASRRRNSSTRAAC